MGVGVWVCSSGLGVEGADAGLRLSVFCKVPGTLVFIIPASVLGFT